jgi:hypothetical protein
VSSQPLNLKGFFHAGFEISEIGRRARIGRMADGKLQMAENSGDLRFEIWERGRRGEWEMANCRWQIADGRWQMGKWRIIGVLGGGRGG